MNLALVNPAPILSSISPTQIGLRSMGALLVANGSNFQSSSVIQGNGIAWPTQYISSGQLTAQMPTDVIATLGTVRISIVTPSPGGGASTEQLLTVVPVAQIYFPQVSVGGGYSTTFALVNVGAGAAQGQLTFVDQSGNPMTVALAGSDQASGEGFQFPISIRPGATLFLTASAPGLSDSPTTGWARIESVGGLLNGVSTFTLVINNIVVDAAGVLAAEPVEAVTIPVDNDSSQNRSTAFAIANPGDTDINVRLQIVDKSGLILNTISPAQLNPLPSQNQFALFLDQILPSTADLRGSVQLIATGGRFIVTALIQNQSQLTAIPVIPGKSPGTP
jgi:hypothetical protein